MPAAYSGRPTDRQPLPRDSRPRAASEVLLDRMAADEHAATIRDESRLRERAMQLLAMKPGDEAPALGRILAELACECGAGAALLARWRSTRGIDVLRATAGFTVTREFEVVATGLLAGFAPQQLHATAFEYPTDAVTNRETVAARASASLGQRSLRWAFRTCPASAEGGEAQSVLVALASRRCVYWTPSNRRLHDGTAEVLSAVVGRVFAE